MCIWLWQSLIVLRWLCSLQDIKTQSLTCLDAALCVKRHQWIFLLIIKTEVWKLYWVNSWQLKYSLNNINTERENLLQASIHRDPVCLLFPFSVNEFKFGVALRPHRPGGLWVLVYYGQGAQDCHLTFTQLPCSVCQQSETEGTASWALGVHVQWLFLNRETLSFPNLEHRSGWW